MRKFEYPKGKSFEKTYLDIFRKDFDKMQAKWETIRHDNSEDLNSLPSSLKEILLADYGQLVKWYNVFKQLEQKEVKNINLSLNQIFNYAKWSDNIAEFFIDPANGFSISTCCYCEMAYINAYVVDPYEESIYFLNNASSDALNKVTENQRDTQAIICGRPYMNKSQFDNIVEEHGLSKKISKLFFPTKHKHKSHFELDHVLPKSEFSLGSLSLYNLLPSCPVCNQRLKRTKVLGYPNEPKIHLSPTSSMFDFDTNAKFSVLSKSNVNIANIKPTISPQDYELRLFSTNADYEDYIHLFHIEERYQKHKKIALHWMEMKQKYSDARIKMIANVLKHPYFSYKRIKSDIFQQEIYESGNMSFTKLRKDILG